jgi:hypothetical protein
LKHLNRLRQNQLSQGPSQFALSRESALSGMKL